MRDIDDDDGHIQLLTFHARFPSLIFTALAITGLFYIPTHNDKLPASAAPDLFDFSTFRVGLHCGGGSCE